MLFLDERRFEHYLDHQALMAVENFSLSAVLKIPRPLDRAFHSLVVASEVLSFRRENGEHSRPIAHPASVDLLRSCRETVASIRATILRENLVTRRFVEILERVETKIESMSSMSSTVN